MQIDDNSASLFVSLQLADSLFEPQKGRGDEADMHNFGSDLNRSTHKS